MSSAADVLFGKVRQAVLLALFEVPERGRYLRELARLTGISPGALQNELGRLFAADLVKKEEDGNRMVYRANVEHPIFSDLQAIVRKTCGLPVLLRNALAHVKGIDFAAIYGSVAKSGEHARSDVDLIVVGSIRLETVLSAVESVETATGREISVRLYTRADFRQRRTKGDAFLKAVLAGPWEPIVGTPNDP